MTDQMILHLDLKPDLIIQMWSHKLSFLQSVLENEWLGDRKLKLFMINKDMLHQYLNENSPLMTDTGSEIKQYEVDYESFTRLFVKNQKSNISRNLFTKNPKTRIGLKDFKILQ